MRSSAGRRGFTLVEVLVVIGVIAVLVAVLLPALRGVRGKALQTVSLANVRSVGQVMAVYAGEYDRHPFRGLGEYPSRLTEVFPGFTPQEGVAMYLWYPRGVLIGTSGHFEQAWLWPSIVLDLEDWPEHWETWVSPSKDRPLPTHADFEFSDENPVRDQISVRYSNAFVARPEFFSERRGASPTEWDRLLKPTRPSEVRYPSAKVMLWDDDLSYRTDKVLERVDGMLNAETPMAFADGHGAVRNPMEASDPSDNPVSGEGAKRVADTRDGVHGRDYE